jgi:transcriptional regulator with XRE-family HTH domain
VAIFLRRKRGLESYAAFGKKVGLSGSTVFRLENGDQSITVQKLDLILSRLKCTVADVFPPNP